MSIPHAHDAGYIANVAKWLKRALDRARDGDLLMAGIALGHADREAWGVSRLDRRARTNQLILFVLERCREIAK